VSPFLPAPDFHLTSVAHKDGTIIVPIISSLDRIGLLVQLLPEHARR